jgi:hypothetical protein
MVGVVRAVETSFVSTLFTHLWVLISAKSVRFMNFSDFFYFTGFTNYADYNYFTNFVKAKIEIFRGTSTVCISVQMATGSLFQAIPKR